MKNTGRWLTATFSAGDASFDGDIVVSAETDLVLHMVEVRR